MATDRLMPSPDMAMSPSANDSPYTIQMKTALRNANPLLADTLLNVLDPPTRKQSHTPDLYWLRHRNPEREVIGSIREKVLGKKLPVTTVNQK